MKNILVVILLLTCASTHAAMIDQGTYFSDTDSGLDWLKLAPTINRSYNDVSSKLGTGQEFDGWRYASGSEYEQLLLNGGVIPDSALSFNNPCSPGVNFCGNSREAIPGDSGPEIISMSDLLGNLAPANAFVDIVFTQGLISDVDTGNIDPTAHFAASMMLTSAIGGGIDTFNEFESLAPGDANASTGSYLVRSSTVPVPAAAWLFGSGLGLLGWMRRKTA